MPATDKLIAIDYLKRRARSARLQAGRSAPKAAFQLNALAGLYEQQAHELEIGQCAAFLDKGAYLAGY